VHNQLKTRKNALQSPSRAFWKHLQPQQAMFYTLCLNVKKSSYKPCFLLQIYANIAILCHTEAFIAQPLATQAAWQAFLRRN